MSTRRLPTDFFRRPAREVAPDLLGRRLLHRTSEGLCGGLIVEVEAYEQGDPASHSHRGITPRNRSMFGPSGRLYVYRSYGIHHCLNIVTGEEGAGEAVLIRALAPDRGLDQIRQNRRGAKGNAVPDRDLLRGPGRLCQGLAIEMELDGIRLDGGPLRVMTPSPFEIPCIRTSPRVGISRGARRRWRFFVEGSPFVSGPSRLNRGPTTRRL